MAFIYGTLNDLCRAVQTGYNFVTGSKNFDEISKNVKERYPLSGTVVMTTGVAILILGSTGCYACYSGRLRRLGIPCAVIGLSLTVIGWDVIQWGRFVYHAAGPKTIKQKPVVYAILHHRSEDRKLGIKREDRRKADRTNSLNDMTDDTQALRKHTVATITANTIVARFIGMGYLWYMSRRAN